jgi:hypothetical protein
MMIRVWIEPNVWAAVLRSWANAHGNTDGGILPNVPPSEEE